MSNRILVAVDNTPTNRPAVDKALQIAKDTGAELTAISVFDLTGNYRAKTGGMKLTQEEVARYCEGSMGYIRQAAEKQGVEFKRIYARGSTIGLLVELSKEYDQIICGSRNLSGIGRFLHTSVSSAVSRKASCPVLVCTRD